MHSTRILFFYLAALLSISFPLRAHDIVLLGDESRTRLLASCKMCQGQMVTVATPRSRASAQDVASSAHKARHAVIVIDASVGPLPVAREHILIARQAGVPSLSLMFTNMNRLEGMQDAGELLELEELEVRELLDKYEMGGDKAMVFHDASIRSIKRLHTNGVGMEAMLRAVQALPERKVHSLEPFSGTRFLAHLYLLTPQESKFTAPLSNASSIGLWINGQSLRARVRTKQAVQPGSVRELEFETDKPIVAPIGSRLLLEQSGNIVGAGVLSRGG
ncbi:translation elongation factor EF-Tu-like GTPase [Acidovorax soli]|uniref:Translation elongation factor EF-Tu-like GTPase n=1 Tax=Acidovorax soli TaxID=592050 RepID=A0A7X0UA15_9BURK|nr:GTP-binding protein [Acidovorax soli]MBB6560085.1 translation elongation factor EF-Tu-like GTPase [Acidovorax soli]